jgi:hypothetical protein
MRLNNLLYIKILYFIVVQITHIFCIYIKNSSFGPNVLPNLEIKYKNSYG